MAAQIISRGFVRSDGIRDISGGDRQPHRVLRNAQIGQQIDHAGAQIRAADLTDKIQNAGQNDQLPMLLFQCLDSPFDFF